MNGKKSNHLYLMLSAAAVALIVLLVGIGAWAVGFSRQGDIVAQHYTETQIALGKITPTITDAQLEVYYNQGVASYKTKEYSAAISQFKTVVNYRPSYKDAALRLLAAYKGQAELQATQLNTLTEAPVTYNAAITLVSSQETYIKNQFPQARAELGLADFSFEGLVQALKDQASWSEHYLKGHDASKSINLAAGWPEEALKEWEIVYKAKPDYLKDSANLSVGLRLSDTYQAKAFYLCHSKGDFSGALSAVNRAMEIDVRNKLPDNHLKVIQNLYQLINQNQCQGG